MNYPSENIEKNLLKTATDPGLEGVLKDYAEVGIDSLFNSELVDAIPVVKSLSAILKGVATIQDRMFLKKLSHFLVNANHMTVEERDAWYKKHIRDNKKAENKIAGKLMIMIDTVNDDYKAEVLGKIFRAFIKGDIDTLDDFFYISELVENCFTNMLKGLSEGRQMTDEALYRAGIKHIPTPTGREISEMLGRGSHLASRGMTAASRLPVSSAEYTSAGKMLIKILQTY